MHLCLRGFLWSTGLWTGEWLDTSAALQASLYAVRKNGVLWLTCCDLSCQVAVLFNLGCLVVLMVIVCSIDDRSFCRKRLCVRGRWGRRVLGLSTRFIASISGSSLMSQRCVAANTSKVECASVGRLVVKVPLIRHDLQLYAAFLTLPTWKVWYPWR